MTLPRVYAEWPGVGVLYCGRCEDIVPTVAAVDAFITSPPYNLGNTTGGGFPKLGHYSESAAYGDKRGGGGKWRRASEIGGLRDGYGIHNDHMCHDEYVQWQKEVLSACWAQLSPNGAIFYNHKPRILGGRLVSPLEYLPADLPVRQVVIWARAGGINFSPAFYLPTHEWVVIIAKDDWRLKSKGASGVGDVWQITQENGTEHPCAFPIELPLKILETINAEIICDPFAGSGTVGAACVRANRRFVLCELNPEYCAIAKARIDRELAQPRLPFVEPIKETQAQMFTQDPEVIPTPLGTE